MVIPRGLHLYVLILKIKSPPKNSSFGSKIGL